MTGKDSVLTYKIGGPRPIESESSRNGFNNNNEGNYKASVWIEIINEIKRDD